MRTGFICKSLLGTGMAVFLFSSCSDPTNSEAYNSLETEQSGLITSIAELDTELKTLQEDIELAKQGSKDAITLQEDLALERDELKSELEDLKDKNSIKERSVETASRDLSEAKDELAELIEVYG